MSKKQRLVRKEQQNECSLEKLEKTNKTEKLVKD